MQVLLAASAQPQHTMQEAPQLSSQPQGPSPAQVLGAVQQLLQRLLGVATDAEQPFMEAGLDSLGLVELRALLAERFGLDLPPTVVFDYPSASSLARHICAQLPAPQASRLSLMAGRSHNLGSGVPCCLLFPWSYTCSSCAGVLASADNR